MKSHSSTLQMIQMIDKQAWDDYEKSDRDLLEFLAEKIYLLEDLYYYSLEALHSRFLAIMKVEFTKYAGLAKFDYLTFLKSLHQLSIFNGLDVCYSDDYTKIKFLHKDFWYDWDTWYVRKWDRRSDRRFKEKMRDKLNGKIKPEGAINPSHQESSEKKKVEKQSSIF